MFEVIPFTPNGRPTQSSRLHGTWFGPQTGGESLRRSFSSARSRDLWIRRVVGHPRHHPKGSCGSKFTPTRLGHQKPLRNHSESTVPAQFQSMQAMTLRKAPCQLWRLNKAVHFRQTLLWKSAWPASTRRTTWHSWRYQWWIPAARKLDWFA